GARLERDRARAWRRVLVPVLVACRTQVGDAAHVIRTEAPVVEGMLQAAPGDRRALAVDLRSIIVANPDLVEFLTSRVNDDHSLSDPSTASLREDLGAFLDLQH